MNKVAGLDVSGKRVFLRVDLDVPLDGAGEDISTRLNNIKPTLDFLVGGGAKQVVIAGHIDRPKGVDLKLSTRHLLNELKKATGYDIEFVANFDSIMDSRVVLFENLRFWPGETVCDFEFARQLTRLADIYVNDAFGNCHRNHASMVALPELLPHAAGLHLQREIHELTRILERPDRPLVAIIGGAKIETKVPVISNISKHAETVLVGGELPIEIGKTGQKFDKNVVVAELEDNTKDISERSLLEFVEQIQSAKTVVWNGPMGLYEEHFDRGTKGVADAIISSHAYSVVGGGETTEFLGKEHLLSRFSFVSAGGGAMLEFLSGKKLPALMALG